MNSRVDQQSENQVNTPPRQLKPGIKMLFVSLLMVSISIALFAYAIDFRFAADGGTASADPPPVKRIPLAMAMVGFGLSTLIFWSAYLRLVRR